jgi:hypothetical protein
MIGGIILFLYGVLGSTTWTAEFLGAKSEIVDAAPRSHSIYRRVVSCLLHKAEAEYQNFHWQ